MNSMSPAKQEKLEALRRRFLSRVPVMVRDVVDACVRLLGGSPDPEGLASALRGAHTLAGTAGTFGLPDVSEAARALEALLRTAQGGGSALEEAAAVSVIVELNRLGRATERATGAPF